ncbi:iron-siderophore ABC transporter substrate-binding protein [Gordonia hankookensis]|uniref:Iron-siderophore ABC transporter substrate-binding protein n=1 Tax=Gordonia hankookensis TaxID=589403 RepID=A0ABR7WEZ3_9ACTN|nr:iron-siderophore ABC transporter substrate-binding protein [Gordonia hankookensis]
MTLVIGLVAGCSSDGDADSAGSSASGGAGGAFPVTIDSAVGKATIEKKPTRVVTIGWGSTDAALALGVVPVGMQDMSGDVDDDSAILPWDKPKLKGAQPTLLKYTSKSVPFEQIAALQPDVILAVNSGLTSEQYSRLSQVAPTVGYPGKAWQTSWQDQITTAGKALGETQKAAQLVDSTSALIAKSKQEHPEFAGKTAAFGSGTTADNFNMYLATDSRVQLLKDLGFTISPSVPTAPSPGGSSYAVPTSIERLGDIESDVMVAWYLSDSVRSGLEGNDVFRTMPAVARHGYVRLDEPALVYATSAVTVLSLPWMLDRYLPRLSDAAQGKARA